MTTRPHSWPGGTASAAVISCALAALPVGCSGGDDPVPHTALYVSADTVEHTVSVDNVSRSAIPVSRVQSIDTGIEEQQFSNRFLLTASAVGIHFLDTFGRRPVTYAHDGNLIERADDQTNSSDDELGLAASLLQFAGQIAVHRYNTASLELYDHYGNPRGSVDLPAEYFQLLGTADGGLVAIDDALSVSKLSASMEVQPVTFFEEYDAPATGAPGLWPREQVAVGSDTIYATSAETYEIAAFDLSRHPRWVVRGADWRPRPIPEQVKQKTLDRTRRAGRAMGATLTDEVNLWPDNYPAIEALSVDGVGRLYVAHYVPEAERGGLWPIDVINAEGELLVNGLLPFNRWLAAYGDRIYRIELIDGVAHIAVYELTLDAAPSSAGQIGR